ncbi:MAG: tetratricopeptide repeat protein [Planctomycetota bacterium]|nr:tetratricopeptide repeat protein [Planctomycetota bacterium]
MNGFFGAKTLFAGLAASALLAALPCVVAGQEAVAKRAPVRGSIVEDRAAKKLIEAGESRFEAEEISKALEIWKSVIERYPRSRFRYQAHMKLGDYYLERDRSYDRARVHFEAIAVEENRDDVLRAEATLKAGICFYHARNYGKCFQIMRDVIESFPVSAQVNQAYYYIGLGHFQLGHYSRAIAALEKVGTSLSDEDGDGARLEAGKRFFVKIEDADLAILDPGESIEVQAVTTHGDEERFKCFPVGRNVRLVLGSIPSRLGQPQKQNGVLDVRGGDEVRVTYVDQHTANEEVDQPVISTVTVVGDGQVMITDGAFRESLRGVVLDKTVNVRISDPDHDVSDSADKLTAVIEVHRRKTDGELEAEAAEAAARDEPDAPVSAPPAEDIADAILEDPVEIDRFKLIDRVEVTLTEVPIVLQLVAGDAESNLPAPSGSESQEPLDADEDSDSPAVKAADSIHTGVFQAVVSLAKTAEVVADDGQLQALPGDEIRVIYVDEINSGEGLAELQARARCLEGNIGGVRVTRAQISNEELRVQTRLKTADALTQIGNRYKEFGLKKKADEKYRLALRECEEIMVDVRKLKGSLLEEAYVQLWHVYFEMDQLNLAAAMCQRLQTEFPSSGFVDDALLQLGEVARTQGDLNRAIGIFNRLVGMQTSQLRGEAQFGIAECYEQMADGAAGNASAQLRDRSFQEYKKVFDQFPTSGRVGEAVAKMAEHYYQQKDYQRAVDTFETVLESHPDAKFLDVILFNYGRCLYRMDRKPAARRRFEQLIGEFPESPLASDAKKISEALAQGGF